MTVSQDYVTLLARYKAWADARLYLSLCGLPAAEIEAKRQIVFGSILRTLHHVYAMDVVWRAHLLGRAHSYGKRSPDDCPDFVTLRAAQRQIDGWYVNYANALSTEQAQDMIEFTFIGGGDGKMSRAQIVLHVVNHTTYHRGHIGDMIYQIPAEPPTTDLPVFMREGA